MQLSLHVDVGLAGGNFGDGLDRHFRLARGAVDHVVVGQIGAGGFRGGLDLGALAGEGESGDAGLAGVFHSLEQAGIVGLGDGDALGAFFGGDLLGVIQKRAQTAKLFHKKIPPWMICATGEATSDAILCIDYTLGGERLKGESQNHPADGPPQKKFPYCAFYHVLSRRFC